MSITSLLIYVVGGFLGACLVWLYRLRRQGRLGPFVFTYGGKDLLARWRDLGKGDKLP